MAKFLDYDGLTYYHNKLKALFIAGVKKNGTALTPDQNGVVDISVPTKTSDLSNDSGFVVSSSLGAVATSNDYTDLDNKPTIPAAQVNSDWNASSGVAQILNKPTIPAAQVNSDWSAASGVAQILNKPTNVSSFTNDSGYQNATQVSNAINSAIAGITGIDFVIVASYSDLPATGTKGVIYLVPNSGTAPNTYDEYIWVEPTGGTAKYEKIGSTAVDLTGYWNHNNSSSNDYLIAMTTTDIDNAISAA